ncbi:hypothetical protein I8752_06415 [Nostocaceae cyanobacterium CENA369]|uniref:Uncharacterized protein n=1 Tax=Dendronalium phyllosphericum CENA369 TaxID=1725256 RepID=A0A8J7LD40_9NOST|nr:hypothetical protein [Dendronalium phyllosphericum]MBH8572651.1 hypothetical protein [Dendronalium phyllosphericum CENA369]
MPETSQLDVIMQQIEVLSLAELLAVRVRVDALIENYSSPFKKIQSPLVSLHKDWLAQKLPSFGSYSSFTVISSENRDVDLLTIRPSPNKRKITIFDILDKLKLEELEQNKIVQFLESEKNRANSLEKVTELIDEWMADESNYDDETYHQIEVSLNKNQPSL